MPHTAKRIVVADDSGLMRRIVASTLRDASFEIVGEAANGDEALALCESARPDAMTLDLSMPGRDGISVLKELRARGSQTRAVVVSAFSPSSGARAVDALAEGAFELIAKPKGSGGYEQFTRELCQKVAAAAQHRARTRTGCDRPLRSPRAAAARTTSRAVVIASSTGGPRALSELVPALPARVGLGTVIVQHMPPGFTASLAERLNRASKLSVIEADGLQRVSPDTALLAPGGSHLRLGANNLASLSDEPPIGALRPRADLTIADAVKLHGPRLLLVVLTGMGQDGLAAAHEVKAAGGHILVEAESTCTVYGMPRAIAEAGLADAVLPLHELPAAIQEHAS